MQNGSPATRGRAGVFPLTIGARGAIMRVSQFAPPPPQESMPVAIMPIIVQKFGGSSVADSQKILAAARKAIRAQKEGNQVVVVVSAMGDNTDLLIDLAKQITDQPPAREMDMLLSTGEQVSVALMAMAIHSLGHKAISMTGAQMGILTDSTHTKARIRSISTERIRRAGRGEHRHCRRFSGDRRGRRHHHAWAAAAATRRRSPWRRSSGRSRAKSTPTLTASTPPIRGSSPKRRRSIASATTRCWSWRRRARA